MTTPAPPSGHPLARQRWLARAALAAAAAALLLLLAAPGVRGLGLLLLVVGHYAVIAIGLWLVVAHRGWVRTAGVALAVAAALSVPLLEAAHGLLWLVVTCAALLLVSVRAARAALRPVADDTARPPEETAPPPRQAYLLMNPRSGGGKVERFGLREKAEQLGAEVVLLTGPGAVDVEELARKAVANGADLLGVAGGDGTQALVAGVAAEHDVPLLVVPAGTRNHFALDLGLDRDDPARSLDALTDGVELRVDLGDVGGRPFVNNVSFGAYAAVVARPDYRDDKVQVTLDVLPDLLSARQGARLTVRAGDVVVPDPAAALVSNNPYGTGDLAGLGRRARLDGGVLGLVAVSVGSARQAAALLRGRRSGGVTAVTTREVVVESEDGRVPAGVDGESLLLPTPVRCQVRPGALRVRLPRERPGVPVQQPPVSVQRLLDLAAWGVRPRTRSAA
ncbi:MAG: diacylglycerol kinase family protein [Mycobacteriales bacterium]